MAPRAEELAPDLWVFRSRSFSYNSGLLRSGRDALLIDPGMFPDEIDGIRDFAAELGVEPAAIVLTHSHWDHILGPERFPGVRVIAQDEYRDGDPEAGSGRTAKTRAELERWEEENEIQRDRPFVMPKADETFAEWMSVRFGERELELRSAPGHWADELIAYESASGLLWAGDMLSDIEIPYVSHGLAAYENTLRMLSRQHVRVLVPGHGQATAEQGEVSRRLSEDRCYLTELRRAVCRWLDRGSLPGNRRSEILVGFTNTPRLEANLYPHRLNIQTVWLELGGSGDPEKLGWGSH